MFPQIPLQHARVPCRHQTVVTAGSGGAGQNLIPGVPSQGSVMQSIEAVIVGDGDVSAGLQQH